jgi:hypothetical protein
MTPMQEIWHRLEMTSSATSLKVRPIHGYKPLQSGDWLNA